MIVPAAESSDEVFVARATAGDDAAFEALVLRYQHRVFRLACRLTSETDAPDVVQETFLQVYRHLSTFRGGAQFSTWVYRIATNAALMHRRARARRPTEPLDEFLPRFDADGKLEETPDALRISSHVDEVLDRHELAKKAQAAMIGCPICIVKRSCSATWRSCPPPKWRRCWAWNRRRCGSASIGRGCWCGDT